MCVQVWCRCISWEAAWTDSHTRNNRSRNSRCTYQARPKVVWKVVKIDCVAATCVGVSFPPPKTDAMLTTPKLTGLPASFNALINKLLF